MVLEMLDGWPKRLGIDVWEVARYLLELALREFEEVREAPHVLAAAAALLALHSLHALLPHARAPVVSRARLQGGKARSEPSVPCEGMRGAMRERDVIAQHIDGLFGRYVSSEPSSAVQLLHPTAAAHGARLGVSHWLRVGAAVRRLHVSGLGFGAKGVG